MAAQAASFTACGAAKSGNPCDRLTAWCASLSRVISRMTDSVNCRAFLDPVSLDIVVFARAVERPGGAIRILRGALALLGGRTGGRRRAGLRLGRGRGGRLFLSVERQIDDRGIRGERRRR